MSSKITVIVAIAAAAMLGITTLAGDSITNSESRVCALETFAQTNLLLATKNGDYKLVQCVSDKLQEQKNEALDKYLVSIGHEPQAIIRPCDSVPNKETDA